MAYNLIKPTAYKSLLDVNETEKAIKLIKDFLQLNLSSELRLRRITAPLFVLKGTGINDDLNGIERPVSFPIKEMNEQQAEIVHSLAKWKRMALATHNVEPGYGIYTDMNAMRPDEIFSNIHSIYVDQWDWERVITTEQRNTEFLKDIVRRLFSICKRIEYVVYETFPQIKPTLPDEITFVHTQDMLNEFPTLSPRERETEMAKKYGAVFIMGVGAKLSNSEKHDGRAPDYDDWSTETNPGYKGLNGDIVFWNPILNQSIEISSMGIRVDKKALVEQLKIENATDRLNLLWHKKLMADELPLSIGGGIGQSRLCMFFLQKAHIGEIQSSIWPEEMLKECDAAGIHIIR